MGGGDNDVGDCFGDLGLQRLQGELLAEFDVLGLFLIDFIEED
jgi:hypothetical protein